MYYKDLTKYKYNGDSEDSLNIGWLDAAHTVNQGDVPKEFLEKLWKYLRYPVQVYRDFHTCNLCAHPQTGIPTVSNGDEKRKVGYYEIRVWGKNG